MIRTDRFAGAFFGLTMSLAAQARLVEGHRIGNGSRTAVCNLGMHDEDPRCRNADWENRQAHAIPQDPVSRRLTDGEPSLVGPHSPLTR